MGKLRGPIKINFNADKIETFSVTLSNDLGEKMVVGYNREANYFYADRSASGNTGFEKEFANFHYAPRLTPKQSIDFTMIIDDASIEIFADKGLTVMTEIFFPTKPYDRIILHSDNDLIIKKLTCTKLRGIWK